MDDVYASLFSACVPAVADNVTSPPSSETLATAGCNATLLFSADGRGLSVLRNLQDGAEFEALRRPALAAVVIGVYVVVLIFGVLGNALVFITVASAPRMRTATNIFIANLALADCFVCAFDLPLNLHYQLTGNWAFGTALCHIIPTVFGIVVYVSTLSLTVIAVDRFALIVVGVKRRMSTAVALILVLVIAAFSTVVTLPMAIFSRQVVYADKELGFSQRYCVEMWPSLEIRKLYTVVTLTVQYFLPLTVIAILYLLVFCHVRASRQQAGSRHRMSRTNRMLAAVVLVFAIAWTPYQLFSVVSEFEPERVSGPYFRFVDLMLRVFAMGSSGVNPFLYGWMNANFRVAFSTILRSRRLPTGAGNNRGPTTEADEFCTPIAERRAIVMRRRWNENSCPPASRRHFVAKADLCVSAVVDVHDDVEHEPSV